MGFVRRIVNRIKRKLLIRLLDDICKCHGSCEHCPLSIQNEFMDNIYECVGDDVRIAAEEVWGDTK